MHEFSWLFHMSCQFSQASVIQGSKKWKPARHSSPRRMHRRGSNLKTDGILRYPDCFKCLWEAPNNNHRAPKLAEMPQGGRNLTLTRTKRIIGKHLVEQFLRILGPRYPLEREGRRYLQSRRQELDPQQGSEDHLGPYGKWR
ncbi:hypothetical protein Y1Q_0023723 [Alligator mississippiensis]|uniref:Uncharacterized protein n=1 Tax=Alligator mississippiensis TaxID=8496 RepID=A0A151MJY6_ALLMI|nr:hypothetical protein Y1Q_0023723 [Alligator mississippiensis]